MNLFNELVNQAAHHLGTEFCRHVIELHEEEVDKYRPYYKNDDKNIQLLRHRLLYTFGWPEEPGDNNECSAIIDQLILTAIHKGKTTTRKDIVLLTLATLEKDLEKACT